jgi:two-component system NtrC family sensor kinase
MQEHRGKIWAQSEPGQGARFVLELPFVACEPAPDDQEPSLPAAATPIDPMRNNQRILVVDDEEGIRDVMTDVLGSLGYGVEAVATGQEALHRLSSSEYNLVISDLCMPGIDGEELWRLVGTQNPGMARRIVFLTGDTVSPQSREFLEATGNRWLTKPFDIADVESTVQAMLASNPLRALTDRRPAQAVRRYYRTGH